MKDINERLRREAREKRRAERDAMDPGRHRTADSRRGRDGSDRLPKGSDVRRSGLDRAQDRLDRLDRIRERDSTRHLHDFDPERARRLEKAEIRTNPEGFRRRHSGLHGLDRETKREVRKSLREWKGAGRGLGYPTC